MRMRFRKIITAAAVLAVVATLLLVQRSFEYVPVLNDGQPGIHDLASLPDPLFVCGSNWVKDGLDRQFSVAQLVAMNGFVPAVADPGFLTPCPAGLCGASATAGPCQTVVSVRVGDDAYVGYDYQGGP